MLNPNYQFAIIFMPLVIWPGYVCIALELDTYLGKCEITQDGDLCFVKFDSHPGITVLVTYSLPGEFELRF